MLGATLRQLNPIFFFGYTDTENMRKQKDRTQTNDVATAEKYSDEITYKLHKWHIMIWPQGATAPLLQQNYQINWLWHLHSLQWHSNLPKGKIRFLLDNMKYTKEKTSQCSIYQAYEVLHEYIYICIYISTFLEKLFKVILFLIIPIDSIKYLVSYLFFTFCPTSSGRFFFETALKVQNTNTDRSMQHLHAKVAWWLKMEIMFMWRGKFLSNLYVEKRTYKPKVGADGEEKDPTKKAHIKRLQTTLDVFCWDKMTTIWSSLPHDLICTFRWSLQWCETS